jgi:hypothetical protein
MPKGIINSYRLVWVFVLVLFGAAIWWFALRSPEASRHAGTISSDQVKLVRDKEQDPVEEKPQNLLESAPKDIEVDDADVVIVGKDDAVGLKLWIKNGTRDGSTFKLVEGTIEFLKDNQTTVLLHVTDGSFASDAGQVRVMGSITGNIDGTNAYFEAKNLMWNQDSNLVEAHSVRYIGPYVDVTGERMLIDVKTGHVIFDGPVTAGI